MSLGRILLVDDEVALAQAMADILELNGYTVTRAENGMQALEAALPDAESLLKPAFDLIITDLEMPELDGIGLIKTIRGFDEQIPILVVTGYGSKKALTDLMRLGVIDCIDKPISSQALLSRIREIEQEQNRRRRKQRSEVEVIEQHCSQYQKRLAVSYQFDLLGRLASGVVHDIANTVQAVMGYLDLAVESRKAGEIAVMETHMQQALEAAEIARTLTLQFQAFSRNEEQEMRPISLMDTLDKSVALSKTTLAKSGACIVIDGFAEDIRIVGNSTMLQVALFNLYLNARDAMNKGGTITVTVEQETMEPTDDNPCGSWCVIRVRDQGCGMIPEVRKKIFEPFFTTKGTQGNGLGLANVLSAVIKHRGAIDVESEMGKGSVFILRIPSLMQ